MVPMYPMFQTNIYMLLNIYIILNTKNIGTIGTSST
jgi:hypothetical protein